MHGISYFYLKAAGAALFLPRVSRDGRLGHRRPDCAVDGPSATPQVSPPDGGGGGGGGRGSGGVGEARNWMERKAEMKRHPGWLTQHAAAPEVAPV